MTGAELKQLLVDRGLRLNDVAQRLGLSPQAFSRRLAVKSVKIDFVEKIEKTLGIELPMPRGNTATASGDSSIAAINSRVSVDYDERLAERIKYLEELLAEKERTIRILMGKMEDGKSK